jgi:hypothetical protein
VANSAPGPPSSQVESDEKSITFTPSGVYLGRSQSSSQTENEGANGGSVGTGGEGGGGDGAGTDGSGGLEGGGFSGGGPVGGGEGNEARQTQAS